MHTVIHAKRAYPIRYLSWKIQASHSKVSCHFSQKNNNNGKPQMFGKRLSPLCLRLDSEIKKESTIRMRKWNGMYAIWFYVTSAFGKTWLHLCWPSKNHSSMKLCFLFKKLMWSIIHAFGMVRKDPSSHSLETCKKNDGANIWFMGQK